MLKYKLLNHYPRTNFKKLPHLHVMLGEHKAERIRIVYVWPSLKRMYAFNLGQYVLESSLDPVMPEMPDVWDGFPFYRWIDIRDLTI